LINHVTHHKHEANAGIKTPNCTSRKCLLNVCYADKYSDGLIFFIITTPLILLSLFYALRLVIC